MPERALADALPYLVWIHDDHGTVDYFNRKWFEYTGSDLETVRAQGGASFVHPADRDEVVRLFSESRQTGQPLEASYRLRRHDGCYRWHLARVVPLHRDGERVTHWLGSALDIDDARRNDLERTYLADAGRVLGSSLDVAQTLKNVAQLVVPELADWCAIDLLGADGRLERAAVAHVDPTKVSLAWQLWERAPPSPDDPHGAYAVIRTGKPEWLPEITDALLVEATEDPDLLETLRALGLRSSVCVPLVAREQPFGALSLVAAESGRLYGERDVAFAEEVARRIAVAVENARLFAAAEDARRAAEAIAHDVIEQSRAAEAALVEMRRERDAALARVPAGEATSA